MAPEPGDTFAAPALVTEHVTPAPRRVEEHIVNILVDVSASPVHNQVHQEQISAEQEKFERVQQHTVEQIVHNLMELAGSWT